MPGRPENLLARNRWLLLRRLSQASVLGLYLLGPLAGVWLIKGNLSASLLLDTVPLTDPLLLLQMLAAGVSDPLTAALTGAAIVALSYFLLGGRTYCSWVCPVNVITDAANWLRTRLKIKPNARLSRNTRYWVLGMTLLLSAATGTLAYEFVNPVSAVHRSLIFGISAAGIALILGIFLFDLLIASRGWCSHLCPMGAFYGLLGAFSPLRVRADGREHCLKGCNDCFTVCPEPQVITPALRGESKGFDTVVRSGNCTNCGRCIDICPESVFRFGLRRQASPAAHTTPIHAHDTLPHPEPATGRKKP